MTDNADIEAVVKRGGAPASAAVANLMAAGESYPGAISDIEAMTDDYSSAAFCYPIAAVAWAYLELHGLRRYEGDDDRVCKLVKAVTDGSLFG